jgi:hypothetical protein
MTDQKEIGMILDWETADRITLLNLQNSIDSLVEENNKILSGSAGQDMPAHRKEDFSHNSRLITFMKEIVKYYGG